MYYRGSAAAVVVYDITDEVTITSPSWLLLTFSDIIEIVQ